MVFIKKISELSPDRTYLANPKHYVLNQNNGIVYMGDFLPKMEVLGDKTSEELADALSGYTMEVQKSPMEDTLVIEPPMLQQILDNLRATFNPAQSKLIVQEPNISVVSSKKNIYDLLSTLHYSHHKLMSVSSQQIDALYYAISDLLNENLYADIQKYKESHDIATNTGIENPLIDKKQLGKIELVLHQFVDSLCSEQKDSVLHNRFRTGYPPILEESKDYLYDKYHKQDLLLWEYNNAMSALETNFYLLNSIFLSSEDKSPDGMHPEISLLLSDMVHRVESLVSKSDTIGEIIDDFFDDVMSDFREKYIEDLDDTTKEKYHAIYALIEQSLQSLIYLKMSKSSLGVLKSSIDTVSAKYLFDAIHTYSIANDKENTLLYLQKIADCDDIELQSLLTPVELQSLLAIIELVDEAYLLAARISRLIPR